METKKLLIICGGIVGGFLLLLFIVWLISALKPKYVTYETVEKRMISASKNYVKNNESKFATDNAKYTLSYQTLVNGEYIKPLDELLKDPTNCVASVTVLKNSGEYSYVPYLNCGDKYTTIELYKKVLSDNEVVTSNSGLYRAIDGTYYFRGKNVNNYVAFGNDKTKSKEPDYIWQILSIGKDNTVRMRGTFTDSSLLKTQWDDRYNATTSKYVGYNMFDDSIIQEKLTDLYEKQLILNNEQRSKLVPKRLCIGTRKIDDKSKDGSTECSTLSKNYYYFSTITPYEFMRISTDPNCVDMSSPSCANFNFIHQNYQNEEWLITSNPENDFQAYSLDGSTFGLVKTTNYRRLYIVVELNEYSFYKSGDGSLENPYRLKLSTAAETNETKTK